MPGGDAHFAAGRTAVPGEGLDEILAVEAVRGGRLQAGDLAQGDDDPERASRLEALGDVLENGLGTDPLFPPHENGLEVLLDRADPRGFGRFGGWTALPCRGSERHERIRSIHQQKAVGRFELESRGELGRISQSNIHGACQRADFVTVQPI